MRNNRYHYARQRRQFKHLSKYLQRSIADGTFKGFSAQKQKRLVLKLKQLFEQVKRTFLPQQLKAALKGAAILLGISISANVQGQSFAEGVMNPFNFQPIGPDFPFTSDIDNDGDEDLFTISFSPVTESLTVAFHENIGTPQMPEFAAAQFEAFGIGVEEITSGSFADIDNDGDFDLFIGEYNDGNVFFLENLGTPEAAAFGSVQINPFGITSVTYASLVNLVDIDNDGDQDLFVSEYYGNFVFFENVGTAEVPDFATPQNNPFNVPTGGYTIAYRFFDFGDIDNDGDLDLLHCDLSYYGGLDNFLFFAENTGDIENPNFAAPTNIENLEVTGILNPAQPAIVDIDNDGDQDVFVGAYISGFEYFENLINSNAAPTSADFDITVLENNSYVFQASDFPFDDPESDPLALVKIVSAPTVGMLTLDGATIEDEQDIPVAQLANLEYTPLPDEFGLAYDAIEFRVSDGLNFSANTNTITINVDENTSTNELPLKAPLSVAPNPVQDLLTVKAELTAGTSEITLRIVNTLGQIVHSQVLNNQLIDLQIEVNQLSTGMYFLELQDHRLKTSTRFIKQ